MREDSGGLFLPAVSSARGLISPDALLPGCSTSCIPSYTAKYTPKLGQSLTRVTAVPRHRPAQEEPYMSTCGVSKSSQLDNVKPLSESHAVQRLPLADVHQEM